MKKNRLKFINGATAFLLILTVGAAIFAQTEEERLAAANKVFAEGRTLAEAGTAESMQASLPKFEEARRLFQESNLQREEAFCLGWLGSINKNLGHKQKALDYYNQSLLLTRAIGDKSQEAVVLNNIGVIYESLKDIKQALEYYSKSLPLYRAAENKSGEMVALSNIATLHQISGDTLKAIEYYNQALPLFRAVDNKLQEAHTLHNIGVNYNSAGNKSKALEYFIQSLLIFRSLGEKQWELQTLHYTGSVYESLNEKQKALEFYNQGLSLARAISNKSQEAALLKRIGEFYSNFGESPKAMEHFNQALLIYRSVGDKKGEASTLHNLGSVYLDLEENQKALDFYNQALRLQREIDDKNGENITLLAIKIVNTKFELIKSKKKLQALKIFDEAKIITKQSTAESFQTALTKFEKALNLFREIGENQNETKTLYYIGRIYSNVGEKQKALEYYNQALILYRAVGDKEGEAAGLSDIGAAYFDLGEYQKALEYHNQALPLFRGAKDKKKEAQTLSFIGLIYSQSGETQKAIEYNEQALALSRAIRDKSEEASTLSSIGWIYSHLDEKQKALEYYNQALLLYRAVGDKEGEAARLNNAGVIYSELGEEQKALEYYNQALSLRRTVGDKFGEAATIANIGSFFFALGESQKALEYYNQALLILRAFGNKRKEAVTLNNIGRIYSELGEKQKALEYYNQALSLNRAVGDKEGEAARLNNIGSLYFDLDENQKALEYYQESLLISTGIKDKSGEASTLNNLMFVWESLKVPRLAVLYGKQSVNIYQELRGKINALDKETQKTFLKSIEYTYRNLAEILISQRRYAEAQQVLNSFKDQQFFDFSQSKQFTPIAVTVREAELTSAFNQKLENIFVTLRVRDDFKRNIGERRLNTDETAQLISLEAKQTTANEDYLALLKSAEKDFTAPPTEKDKFPDVPDLTQLQTTLRETSAVTKQNAAAVYTLVGEENFRTLIITPDDIKSVSVPIKNDVLNEKAKQFWALLQSDKYDTTKLGKELYDTVFKPIEKELPEDTQTILWSLDGNLRYVPMAALYDGEKKQYLVERYQNVVFTRADVERMTRAVSPVWTGTGFGTSEARTVSLLGDSISFNALGGVTKELNEIFRTADDKSGIIGGEVLKDKKFNQKNMLDALKAKRPLVHIASHFSFRPGDEARSFLLMGDGTAFTLEEMKKEANLFQGVELLTLSACNTAATQADANGREVDGFAELAQRLGAGAVMASLWAVADESTSLLMSEFYRLHKENPQMTKSEAIRQAQIAMLNGKIKQSQKSDQDRTTGVKSKDKINAPPFVIDETKPFAHPYYWSPFILIGNWK